MRHSDGSTHWLFICAGLLVAWLSGCGAPARQVQAQVQDQELHQYTNELIHSTSPYLLQHAHNPVHWMPWGPAAFAKAKAENKPIFVSIGYSTCYWCHVMERESFENEEVAKILNEHYVAIKVDREERPDIDEQLMLATQLLTGRGGWPNSVWLTVDGRPWMAGTYFPREQFKSALLQLSQVFRVQAEAVDKQANSLADAIREASAVEVSQSMVLDQQPILRLMAELEQTYDAEHGGFGTRPKFPPHGMLRLLAHAAAQGDSTARTMMTRTLDAMWCGGVHDHVGGGFHRYSTDERWFLPHFEKMLYDNGQLMRAYTEAYAVTEKPLYREAVEDIFGWLQREMTHEQGGFYSAIDSESEDGEEGRYYTWSADELKQVLSSEDAVFFEQHFHFEATGNFAEEATGERNGTNIPYLRLEQLNDPPDPRWPPLRDALIQARTHREYPHLDDKVLTAWNGLMISSLARAGKVFGEPRYTAAAQKAAEFVLQHLQVDGQLNRSWRANQASLPAYLNDYAFLAEALLELHAATGDSKWQDEAVRCTDQLLELFEDERQGGFFFTNHHHEELLLRSKNLTGGGNLPVGNGVAVQVLLRLHDLTGQTRYLASAERALQSFTALMRRSPRQVEHLVLANVQYLDRQARSELAASAPPADDSHEDQAVRLRLFTSRTEIAPGEEFKLAVEVNVANGFHLYGSDSLDSASTVQPTMVTLQAKPEFVLGSIVKPSGDTRFDNILAQPVTTLSGQVQYVLPVTVARQTVAGSYPLEVQVSYQACDNTQCLEPQQVTLKAEIEVKANALSTPRFPGIFGP